MTASTSERTNHAEQVGNIEDLGSLDALPKRPINAPPGKGRQYNPFDDKVVETFQTGRPRLAVADDLESAKVLIRRAAAHANLGIDIVPTVTPDGRDAVAYLARAKRVKKDAAADEAADSSSGATTDDDVESYDEDDQDEEA